MERLTVKWKDKCYDTLDPIDIADNEYSKINYEKLLVKLGEYEDAEEQGLLLKLPCKVGDSIYFILDNDIIEYEVRKFTIWRNELYAIQATREIDGKHYWNSFYVETLGKETFLTRAEAEQALDEDESEV